MFPKLWCLLAGGAALAATASCAPADTTVLFASKGTGAKAGIMMSNFDPVAGTLSKVSMVAQTDQCTYFTLAPDGKHAYVCNSVNSFGGQAKTGAVSAYSIDPATRKFTLLNQKPSMGVDPCYISLDNNSKFAFIANYEGNSVVGEGGTACAYAILPDGSFGERTAFIQQKGSSIDPTRQMSAYAHSIHVDPSNKFAFLSDLGQDKLFVFKFDDKTGSLTPNDPAFTAVKPGSGPRHFSFHPNGKLVYIIQEMGSMITACNWDDSKGVITPFQEISTLPDTFKGKSTCAEIHVHPNGKWLYATNRGDDSIAQFSIDPASGKLTMVGTTPSAGKIPRGMEFDPSAKWMVVSNQDSENAVLFAIDVGTGKLTQKGAPIAIDTPFCPRFLVK